MFPALDPELQAREDLRAEFAPYRCRVCGTKDPRDHDYFCGMQDEEGLEPEPDAAEVDHE